MQKSTPASRAAATDRQATALTAAGVEAARRLGLSPSDAAACLGVPPNVFAAMKKGQRAVDGFNGEAAAADALVRLIKRLTVLLGDSETKWRSWLRHDNADLASTPLALLLKRDGAVAVAQYLEQTRTKQVGAE